MKYCLAIIEYGSKEERKTFTGFEDAKKALDRKEYFDLSEREAISGTFPIGWKESFDGSVEILSKDRNCKNCLKSETMICEFMKRKFSIAKNLKII